MTLFGRRLFKTDMRFPNLHEFQGPHVVLYVNEKFFDSNGCAPPQNLPKFIIKPNGHCLYSEYKTQCLTIKKFLFVRVIFYKNFI